MKTEMLDMLVCVLCQGRLAVASTAAFNGELLSGELACGGCGRRYPVEQGVPRLLHIGHSGDDQVKRRFELQWRTWGREEKIFGRTSADAMNYFLANLVHPDMTQASWKGKLVLDAGCGHGMYVRQLGEAGARIVGLDVSETVLDVYARLRHQPSVYGLQANVLHPGLAPRQFDVVFSNGVIHHTGDTRMAFRRMAELVRLGGYLGVWVYPFRSRLWEAMQAIVRAVTTRVPARLLYYLCYLPVPLLSVFPAYSGTSLKTASWRQCAQVVFDFYAPRHQTHHHPEEIAGWFREEGFDNIRVMPDAVSVTGKRVRD